jgi:hypothetical protein
MRNVKAGGMNRKFHTSALQTPAASIGQRPTRRLNAIVASRYRKPTAR